MGSGDEFVSQICGSRLVCPAQWAPDTPNSRKGIDGAGVVPSVGDGEFVSQFCVVGGTFTTESRRHGEGLSAGLGEDESRGVVEELGSDGMAAGDELGGGEFVSQFLDFWS